MSEKEAKEFSKMLEEYSKETVSKEEARRFLRAAGIIDSKNKPAKHYKNLCIPAAMA